MTYREMKLAMVLASTALMATGPVLAQAAGQAEPALTESASTPEARQAMHAFAACAADQSTDKALSTLLMDFRTTKYRSALKTLALDNRKCLDGGKMQSAGILFAAGMAERLLETRFSPTGDILVRAAAKQSPEPRNASDALAICVVRAAPAQVASLFATDVASTVETGAAQALTPAIKGCAGNEPAPTISVGGLRAILATAALRVAAV